MRGGVSWRRRRWWRTCSYAARRRRAQPRLVVVQAIPKGDHAERAVDLLTEIGVDVIVPWAAERNVVTWKGDRAAKALNRWRATALAAAKQSRRSGTPRCATCTAPTTWSAGRERRCGVRAARDRRRRHCRTSRFRPTVIRARASVPRAGSPRTRCWRSARPVRTPCGSVPRCCVRRQRAWPLLLRCCPAPLAGPDRHPVVELSRPVISTGSISGHSTVKVLSSTLPGLPFSGEYSRRGSCRSPGRGRRG